MNIVVDIANAQCGISDQIVRIQATLRRLRQLNLAYSSVYIEASHSSTRNSNANLGFLFFGEHGYDLEKSGIKKIGMRELFMDETLAGQRPPNCDYFVIEHEKYLDFYAEFKEVFNSLPSVNTFPVLSTRRSEIYKKIVQNPLPGKGFVVHVRAGDCVYISGDELNELGFENNHNGKLIAAWLEKPTSLDRIPANRLDRWFPAATYIEFLNSTEGEEWRNRSRTLYVLSDGFRRIASQISSLCKKKYDPKEIENVLESAYFQKFEEMGFEIIAGETLTTLTNTSVVGCQSGFTIAPKVPFFMFLKRIYGIEEGEFSIVSNKDGTADRFFDLSVRSCDAQDKHE